MNRNTNPSLKSVACVAALALALSAPAHAGMTDLTLASAEPTPPAKIPAAPANGEMAFMFSNFATTIIPGWEGNCPTGWSFTPREAYLETVSKAERTRLLKPENEEEYNKKWQASVFGPNNTNICTNYDKFPDRPPQKEVQSKIAFGLNLDGADDGKASEDPYFCPHQNFTNPLGEKGIDNQVYRSLGCARIYRAPDGGPAEMGLAKRWMATGEFSIVLLLRGVDNLVNDDKIEVIIGTSPQQAIVDSQQNFIAGASYHISPNPRWRHELKGKIVGGVLETESKDIILQRALGRRPVEPTPGSNGNAEWDFQRMKMRLAFREDGTLEGLLAGYIRPVDILAQTIGGGRGTAITGGIDCASRYNALMKNADGERDPATGKCKRVSESYHVAAVPAFVFDRPPESVKTAARTEDAAP